MFPVSVRPPARGLTHARPCRPALALALGLFACLGCRNDERPSAILITLDTTRRDAIGAYGEARAAQTPTLDDLATRGIVFERAHTVAPLTLPAHASMLTGLYPPRHGLRDNGHGVLPASVPSVAQAARAAGFQTGAFVAAVVLDPSFGLARGFEVYVAPLSEETGSMHVSARSGAEVVAAAREWLRGLDRERPFFLWVHFFEPHAPYEPPLTVAAANGGDPYLGEVSVMDAHVAELLAEVERLGVNTTVLVVADHGEGLDEHEEKTHGYFLYEGTLAVPFLLVRADGARAGERNLAEVSVVDVAPTLAEAMGLEPTPGLDGQSLWEGSPNAGRGVYFESYAGHLSFGWSPITGWIEANRKYIHSPSPEFFDLSTDAREQRNLVGPALDLSAQREAIGRVAANTLPTPDGPGIDPELLGDINALGYAAVGAQGDLPHPLEESQAPSPHASAAELRMTLYATRSFNEGRPDAALPVLDAILERNPANLRALGTRINCLMALDRKVEAVEPLQEYLRRVPGRAAEHYNLGVCLQEAGRGEEAIESFRVALRMEKGEAEWVEGVAGLLEKKGYGAEVQAWRERRR